VAERSWFESLAERSAKLAGSRYAFGIAFGIIILWAVTGPAFGFSDTWQIVINTATTIVTFLMVFLLQNSQNRESKALSVKIDELIRATETASNRVIGLEEKTESEIRAAAEEIREAVEEPCGKATGRLLDDPNA
jgi:low affinity Fe/Cu permease